MTGVAAPALSIVDRLSEFVAIPSVSGQEAGLADRIAEIVRGAGVSVSVERPGRSIVARRGSGSPCLLLNSHLDTVPPAAGWSADPWTVRIDGDRVIGLGANDAKASVAAQLDAFLTAPLPDENHGSLIFAATCDEETGGEGLEKLIPRLSFDDAIIGEPNDFSVAVSQKGLVKLRLTCVGTAGHASRPHLAQNAISAAAQDIVAIHAMKFSTEDPLLGHPTAVVTEIQGGVRSNVIPDRCVLTVDARTVSGFDNDAMIEAIRSTVAAKVEVLSARLRPVSGDPNSRIARAALAAAPGRVVTGFPSGSDLAHVGGKPAIVFGPGTPDQSHRADESISISSLRAAPDVYRRAIAAYFDQ